LPALICEEAVDAIEGGEVVDIDLKAGQISCSGGIYTFPALPGVVVGIFKAGGLVEYTRKKLVRD
jgi:3-isopropylmalate/(R)-2-methylmalate dehydratase small subunit